MSASVMSSATKTSSCVICTEKKPLVASIRHLYGCRCHGCVCDACIDLMTKDTETHTTSSCPTCGNGINFDTFFDSAVDLVKEDGEGDERLAAAAGVFGLCCSLVKANCSKFATRFDLERFMKAATEKHWKSIWGRVQYRLWMKFVTTGDDRFRTFQEAIWTPEDPSKMNDIINGVGAVKFFRQLVFFHNREKLVDGAPFLFSIASKPKLTAIDVQKLRFTIVHYASVCDWGFKLAGRCDLEHSIAMHVAGHLESMGQECAIELAPGIVSAGSSPQWYMEVLACFLTVTRLEAAAAIAAVIFRVADSNGHLKDVLEMLFCKDGRYIWRLFFMLLMFDVKDVDLATMTDRFFNGDTSLHEQKVRCLCAWSKKSNKSVLIYAIMMRRWVFVRKLLSFGVPADMLNSLVRIRAKMSDESHLPLSVTPLGALCMWGKGNEDIAMTMIAQGARLHSDRVHTSAFQFAILANFRRVVKELCRLHPRQCSREAYRICTSGDTELAIPDPDLRRDIMHFFRTMDETVKTVPLLGEFLDSGSTAGTVQVVPPVVGGAPSSGPDTPTPASTVQHSRAAIRPREEPVEAEDSSINNNTSSASTKAKTRSDMYRSKRVRFRKTITSSG